VDRLVTELQRNIRKLITDPVETCADVGVSPEYAEFLLSIYGTNVVYGNTLRDLDAVMRSAETQIQVQGRLNVDSLTGRTDFEEVRRILDRLENPEPIFEDRLHLISASAMMSHGVDIDRLNVMVMLGLPLTTSEFIQATARIGRRWPGLILVVHKIGRERDASVFRSFSKFIEQGDRFVEPIPITRRSRRVLERTAPGLELARLYVLHDPTSPVALTTLKTLREYANSGKYAPEEELQRLCEYLNFDGRDDARAVEDLERWLRVFFRNIADPLPGHKFPSDAWPNGRPMQSLRDVEEQVPVFLNYLRS
jgi:hypothetical protein